MNSPKLTDFETNPCHNRNSETLCHNASIRILMNTTEFILCNASTMNTYKKGKGVTFRLSRHFLDVTH